MSDVALPRMSSALATRTLVPPTRARAPRTQPIALPSPLGTDAISAVLARAITATPTEDLPQVIGMLSEAVARAQAKLLAPPATPPASRTEPRGKWIKPADAAKIAAVPVKRIYEWAAAKSWASRPTRRCLRIDETAFRLWLTAR